MKKFLLFTIILFASIIKADARRIFSHQCLIGDIESNTSWNDQVIITGMNRSDLLPYMINGHEYMVKVTYQYPDSIQEIYSFYAEYTCNLNETDEKGNIINADYGTLYDGAYVGFFNIATDVPTNVQEERRGTDYIEDDFDSPHISIDNTFGFHFETDYWTPIGIHIEVFD